MFFLSLILAHDFLTVRAGPRLLVTILTMGVEVPEFPFPGATVALERAAHPQVSDFPLEVQVLVCYKVFSLAYWTWSPVLMELFSGFQREMVTTAVSELGTMHDIQAHGTIKVLGRLLHKVKLRVITLGNKGQIN